MSQSTIWRILDRDARTPWRYRSGILPRDVSARWWDGLPMHPEDCVISADEKTSIQARPRGHASRPPPPRRGKAPGQPVQVEQEYARGGAPAYLAAWDVRRGHIWGRCAATTGKPPFGHLVDQLTQHEPCRAAPRVF
jgi:hypothetical protein